MILLSETCHASICQCKCGMCPVWNIRISCSEKGVCASFLVGVAQWKRAGFSTPEVPGSNPGSEILSEETGFLVCMRSF